MWRLPDLHLQQLPKILENSTWGNSDHSAKSHGVIRITRVILTATDRPNSSHFAGMISVVFIMIELICLAFSVSSITTGLMPTWIGSSISHWINWPEILPIFPPSDHAAATKHLKWMIHCDENQVDQHDPSPHLLRQRCFEEILFPASFDCSISHSSSNDRWMINVNPIYS